MDLKKIGFWLGIFSFFLVLNLPNPEGLSDAGRVTGAVFLLMGVWWAFEAIPLQVTALLPLILFPLLGVLEIGVRLVGSEMCIRDREYGGHLRQFLFR